MKWLDGIWHRVWKIGFSAQIGSLLLQQRYQEAETFCREAISKLPRSALCHEWLGKVLWKQRRLDEAIQEYRVGIGLQKAALSADRIDLLQLFLQAGRYEEAIAESQKLLDPSFHKISPFFRGVHELTAFRSMYEAYFALGDFAQAKEALVKLLPCYRKREGREQILQRIRFCEEHLQRPNEDRNH